MPPTRSFRETIREQLTDEEFRREFLRETMSSMISGDLETAKSALREYINGTIGFVALGDAVSKSPKSLMRMLSPAGNPQARNLFEMIAYLQKMEGTVLEVRARKAKAA
jgi:DNA-binding phage protein